MSVQSDTSIVVSDVLPVIARDAMLGWPGLLYLLDTFDQTNTQTRPSNYATGASVPAVASVLGTSGLALGSGTNVAVPSTTVNTVGNPTRGWVFGSNGSFTLPTLEVYNKPWVKILWYDQETGFPTGIQSLHNRGNGSSAPGNVQSGMYMAPGGGNILTGVVGNAIATALLGIGASTPGQFRQVGQSYDPATGIMQMYSNGALVGTTLLTGGGNLAQPSSATENLGTGFASFTGYINRFCLIDLSAGGLLTGTSQINPLDIVTADYISQLGRFV